MLNAITIESNGRQRFFRVPKDMVGIKAGTKIPAKSRVEIVYESEACQDDGEKVYGIRYKDALDSIVL